MLNICQVSSGLREAVNAFLEGHLPVPVGTKWGGLDCTHTNLEAMQKLGVEMKTPMLAPNASDTYSPADRERYDHFQAVLTAISENRPVRKESLKILRQAPAIFTSFIKNCEYYSIIVRILASNTPEKIERTPENLARWEKVARMMLNNEAMGTPGTMSEHLERELSKSDYEQLLNGDIEPFERSLTSACNSFKAKTTAKQENLAEMAQMLRHLRNESAAICMQVELDNLFSSEKRER